MGLAPYNWGQIQFTSQHLGCLSHFFNSLQRRLGQADSIMAELGLDELCVRAKQAVAARKFADGRTLYAQAVSIAPESADAHFGLATCYFLLGELDAALEHFDKVTRLDPHRGTPFVNMGAIYNRIGQQDKAIECLRRGLAVDHRCAEGYYNLGIAYRQKGMVELAMEAYREAARLNPNLADASLNLGNVLFELRRYREAVSAYRQAIAVRPEFKKAQVGLKNAEKAIAETAGDRRRAVAGPEDDDAATPSEKHAPAAEQAAVGFTSEKDRTEALRTLSEACANHEEFCRELGRVIEEDLRPALQDLSHALVGKPAFGELELRTMAYSDALEALQEARNNMVGTIEQIRKTGRRFAAEIRS